MARVVVTGGAGFIGSHIVDAMLAEGHSVAVLDDLSSGFKENVATRAELKVLDVRSNEARTWLAAQPPEVFIHAAAQMSVRVSMEDPTKDVDINVRGLVNCLQAFSLERLPYVVFISTGGAIYGEQERFPANESHPIQPTSVYGLSKWVSEQYLDFWRRMFGLKVAALRLGNVYGPRQSPHGEAGVVAIFSRALRQGKVPLINGTGEQTRDFVYVADVVDAIRAAVAQRPTGAFNIGTGKETSVNQLYGAIAAASGSATKANYGPAKAGEQMRSVIDASKALNTFGWKPVHNVAEGIRKTVEWFQKQ